MLALSDNNKVLLYFFQESKALPLNTVICSVSTLHKSYYRYISSRSNKLVTQTCVPGMLGG
jgi:hypothetical protein